MPAAALELADSVRVDDPEPGAAMLDGLKLAVTPDGSPLADSETALLKPPEMVLVIVEVPELPAATVTEPGLADSEKLGAPLMVRLRLVLSERPPPFP